jgi:chromate transporter
LVVLALSMAYAAYGAIPFVQAAFLGVQAAVIAIVIEALIRVSRKALQGRAAWIIAALSFAALFLFNLPFPLIIGAAALWGFLRTKGRPAPISAPAQSNPAQSLRTLVIWGGLWLLPLAALWAKGGLLFEIGWFFSKLAVVTFGGAYAVLAWMAQDVVAVKGWLTTQQMMAGLGLAETTPGPLILVTEFVAYMGGHAAGGVALGIAAAGIALWMTFIPCFLWIFLGAPYLERLTHAPRISGALSGIMAAVVGVIANLSLWFALHFLFAQVGETRIGPLRLVLPEFASLQPMALALAGICALLLLRFHRPLWLVLLISIMVSLIFSGVNGG